MKLMKGERLAALLGITAELTQAECPCQFCMGPGCDECGHTGADLDSLASIRAAVAKALEVVSRAKPPVIEKLAQELRGSR